MKALVIKMPDTQESGVSEAQLKGALEEFAKLAKLERDFIKESAFTSMADSCVVSDVILLPPAGSLDRDLLLGKIANAISEGIDVPAKSDVDVDDRVDIAQTIVEELTE